MATDISSTTTETEFKDNNMYYVKIEDNQPVGYPMLEATVREMLSNVSLPAVLDTAELLTLGFAPFIRTTPPDAGVYQRVAEIAPTFDGSTVTQQFEVTAMGEQEIAVVDAAALDLAKSQQRNLLALSDWTEMPSVQSKHTAEWIAAWAEYRTLVRDTDKQEHWPFTIDWPKEPLIAN
jgi:hypothetical protein